MKTGFTIAMFICCIGVDERAVVDPGQPGHHAGGPGEVGAGLEPGDDGGGERARGRGRSRSWRWSGRVGGARW